MVLGQVEPIAVDDKLFKLLVPDELEFGSTPLTLCILAVVDHTNCP